MTAGLSVIGASPHAALGRIETPRVAKPAPVSGRHCSSRLHPAPRAAFRPPTGRLRQVCDRWIYTASRCFGLDLAEQGISGFRYDYSVYQAEYSRSLLFASGGKMEDLLTGCWTSPALRTLLDLYAWPHWNRASGPPAQEIEPRHGLTWFRVRFRRCS
jgi:hypothetical protein